MWMWMWMHGSVSFLEFATFILYIQLSLLQATRLNRQINPLRKILTPYIFPAHRRRTVLFLYSAYTVLPERPAGKTVFRLICTVLLLMEQDPTDSSSFR